MARDNQKINEQVLEEAASWFVDFSEGDVDLAIRKKFDTWLRRSPEHVRAYLSISALWDDADAIKGRNSDIDALIARAQAEHNVYPLELGGPLRVVPVAAEPDPSTPDAPSESNQSETRGKSDEIRRSRRHLLALAAAIVLAFGGGVFALHAIYSQRNIYATEIGEQRSITLEDGSSVELNAVSRLKVRFTDDERVVELVQGQALFKVAKNHERPFLVRSNGTSVRAIGTEFDVYRKKTGTVVTVVEGRVAVKAQVSASGGTPAEDRTAAETAPSARKRNSTDTSSTSVHAGTQHGDRAVSDALAAEGAVLVTTGEQLIVTPTTISKPKPTNVSVAMAWTEKKLVFESTPLQEVVEEFNRYNRQQLVILDPELYDYHISGVFPSTDSSRMVEFLKQRFGVALSRSGTELEISRHLAPPPDTTT